MTDDIAWVDPRQGAYALVIGGVLW